MNFFTNELQKIVRGCENIHQPKFVGRECVGRLTDDIAVKLSFDTMGYANHYSALKIRLINRHEGQIDLQILRFDELWGNVINGINPHAWSDGGDTSWYAFTPTSEQYRILSDELDDYLSCFTDLEQEEAESMELSM